MAEVKKKFKDTGFGKLVSKVGEKIPDVLGVAAKVATGNITGAMADFADILTKDGSPEAKAALLEFNSQQAEWVLELYKLDIQDRESARVREVELAKSGKKDWMMQVVGIVGLLSFAFMLYTMVYVHLFPENRELFIHLLGMVEGVVISIFSYYYGSSAGSRAKDEKMVPSR